MAEAVIAKTPDPLRCIGVNQSAEWDRWKFRFDIFLQATGASVKPDLVKVGLLLNHVGDDGLEIFSNFKFLEARPDPDNEGHQLPAERKDDYTTVVRKFDEFFHRRDPQLMLREQFWYQLKREAGQTFDTWLRVVKDRAKACRFETPDAMVRDKLVFACQDDTAKLKLYDIGASLTLEKAVEILQMREMTKQELASSKTSTIDALSKGSSSSTREQKLPVRHQDGPTNCGYCNRKHKNGNKNCPAANKICMKCQKVGHFAIVCRGAAAGVRTVSHEQADAELFREEEFYVGGVNEKSTTTSDAGWHIRLKVGSRQLSWCIDTGAQVTVMPDTVYKPEFGRLQPADRRLFGPGDQSLDVKGYAYITLGHGKTHITEKVYVVKTSKLLLGMPAIQKLGLICNIHGAFTIRAISTAKKRSPKQAADETVPVFNSPDDVKRQYPQLFTGLGKLSGERHNGFSPAQLSMGRRLKTRVPCPPETLIPQTPDATLLRKREKEYRDKMQADYNRRHRVAEPDPIGPGCKVWIPDLRKEGTVVGRYTTPRSLVIKTSDGGVVRRNQRMVRKMYPRPSVPSRPSALNTPSTTPLPSNPGALSTPTAPPTFCVPRIPVQYPQSTIPSTQNQRSQQNQPDSSSDTIHSTPAVVPSAQNAPTVQNNNNQNITTTRSGRVVRKPARYRE